MSSMMKKAILITLENWKKNCSSQKGYAEAVEHLEKWLEDNDSEV